MWMEIKPSVTHTHIYIIFHLYTFPILLVHSSWALRPSISFSLLVSSLSYKYLGRILPLISLFVLHFILLVIITKIKQKQKNIIRLYDLIETLGEVRGISCDRPWNNYSVQKPERRRRRMWKVAATTNPLTENI